MEEAKDKISCPTFQKQESLIENITGKINNVAEVQEKARHAEELQKEADVLLSCQEYSDKSLDCKNCHFIANLRSKTAGLIIKAKKLA
ncbi:hypothetical protein HQ584_03985 [Patescibacteria group bacterium]|nr:hypothetical protein [Patescibacteria group bacterium]